MKTMTSVTQRGLLRSLRTLLDADPVLCAVSHDAARQMPGFIVESVESSDWASLTFVGEHHRIVIRLPDASTAADLVRARLDQLLIAADMVVPGQIVAEIAVVAADIDDDATALTIEALTLRE